MASASPGNESLAARRAASPGNESLAARREEKERDAKRLDATAQQIGVAVRGRVKEQEKLAGSWEVLCKALETNPEAMKKMNTESAKRGAVNLLFLVVILGCEIDLYGFGMAFRGYWNIPNQYFVKIMVILGPVGYFLAAAMYMIYAPQLRAAEEKQRLDKKQRAEKIADDRKNRLKYVPEDAELPGSTPESGAEQSQSKPEIAKQPILLKPYHFIPVWRYYLVVKDKTTDDIEGVFRVNSLSSFSLGMAQICGIIFFGMENGWKLDTFTVINICSQVINWMLTFLYFVTPISAKMGAALKVEALVYNSDARLREKLEKYTHLLHEDSEHANERTQAELNQWTANLDREILTLANLKGLDLQPFKATDKFQTLKFLHRKMNNVYSKI